MGINCNSTSLTTMRLLNSLLLIASGAYAKHCGVRINHNARHENVTTYLETRLTANRWAASNDELVFSRLSTNICLPNLSVNLGTSKIIYFYLLASESVFTMGTIW